MLLTGREMVDNGFITIGGKKGDETRIRAVSYDLGIDVMIGSGLEIDSNYSYTIAPHETVILISAETIHVKIGHVGHALPKTSLCNEGILALNTGIIDPGYKGRLSATVINFSNIAVHLKKNDPFLRIEIQQLTSDAGKVAGTDLVIADYAYKEQRRANRMTR